MSHDCTVIFHQKGLFDFANTDLQKAYETDQQYTFTIETKRTSLAFISEDQLVCQLPTKNIQSKVLLHGQKQLKMFTIPDTQSKEKQEVVTILGPKKCLQNISELTAKNRSFKSCLAFIPSQVQHISILSGESSEQKYRGFLNLIGIMFIILNIRNIIDNFVKYGLQFKQDPGQFFPIHTLFAYIGLFIFPLMAYFLEKIKFLKILPLPTCKILLRLNLLLLMAYNIIYCRKFEMPAFVGVFYTAICMIVFLKLISFLQVNSQLFTIFQRFEEHKNDTETAFKNQKPKKKKKHPQVPLKRRQSETQFLAYMTNHFEISSFNLKLIHNCERNWEQIISIKNLIYFLFAPTLCYQLQYPKTTSIRKIWLLKRIVQFILVSALQVLLWFQYISPQLQNLYETLIKDNYTVLQIINRHLRLAVPNCIMWIAGFYNCFHLMMNISAELLQFADRNFYMDWWNCRTLEEYWKTWNLPVHFFFLRHVYNPLLRQGYSKNFANIIVFFFSALAHEYVVSIPLKLVTWWAFLAMMMQAPVIIIQKKFGNILKISNSELGNVSFWISFCFVGQPIVVFIYYVLFMKNYTNSGGFETPIPLDIKIDL